MIAALTLATLRTQQWLQLADKLLVLTKRLQLLAVHRSLSPSLEFLLALSIHFLTSRLPPLPPACPLEVLRGGLQRAQTDERAACEELMSGASPRTSQLFAWLCDIQTLPSSLLKRWKDAALSFCRIYFALCCHHLSLAPLWVRAAPRT